MSLGFKRLKPSENKTCS